MIDEETKADIRRRVHEAKSAGRVMDVMSISLLYPEGWPEKELDNFICDEAGKAGIRMFGCELKRF